MCLTIPKQIISVNKNVVRLKDDIYAETAASLVKIKKGDWVLTQNVVRHGSPQSVIIKKITAKQAKEILKIIKTYDR